jgi:hypothetical protein
VVYKFSKSSRKMYYPIVQKVLDGEEVEGAAMKLKTEDFDDDEDEEEIGIEEERDHNSSAKK